METLDIRFRPKTYEEVIGQESAIAQLQGKVVRSYILQGPSGTGKTTMSRIFAREMKADTLELDTASLGKADIETLKTNAYYKPMFHEKKVIILDEVHNLSKQAWESLLKVIEEGPDFVVWFLLTTEVHKIPKTIVTRSRMIELERVPLAKVKEHLTYIAKELDKEVPEEIIHEISAYADGGVREAVKLLETYISTGSMDINYQQLDHVKLIKAVYEKDYDKIVAMTENFSEKDVEMQVRLITDYITMLLLLQTSKERATPGNDVGETILAQHTSLNPNLIDHLRDMQSSILNNFSMIGNKYIEVTINSLYALMTEVMRNYNTFQEVKYTTRGALLWFSQQL